LTTNPDVLVTKDTGGIPEVAARTAVNVELLVVLVDPDVGEPCAIESPVTARE
jgi:hypothetical protein